jgi:hypothetical protein
MDASLYFGTGNAKQEKLTETATILGYAAQQNSDLFTGVQYTQGQSASTPPTKQLYHIEDFSQSLYNASLLNTSLDYSSAVKDLFKRLHRPSLLFILSDFLEEIDLSLLSQKHEVIAVVIRDREEEFPKKLGEVTLSHPQDSKSMETYFGQRSIESYLAKLKENDEKLAEHFTRYGIRSVKIYTDDEVVTKLVGLFV